MRGRTGGPDFVGGGEMGALMRLHEWSGSPLGDPAAWPPSLRSVVGFLLNSTFPMFVAWGPELALLYNDAYRPILGARHPGALGSPFRAVWPEAWAGVEPLVAKALAGEATFHENRHFLLERNGYPEDTWYTFSYSPVQDESGAVGGMFCVCTETTEQVAAQRKLRESEDNYRHASDLSPQTAWTARPDGQLDHVGARWREWTGTSGLGSTWAEVMHPDDLARSVEVWTRSVTTGAPYDIVHRARFRDGSYRWMHSRALPRRDEAGGVIRWYGTTEDVHAVRAVQDALRESEARFRNMADHAPVMMWVTDAAGRCTWLNRRWYEFTGQEEQEALGLGWTKATHPDDQQAVEGAFLAANAAQAPFRVEYRLRRADGVYRWAIDAASPRFGEDGAYHGYVGSVIDIDERKREETRRAALADLGDRIRDIDDPAELSFAAAEILGRTLGVSRAGYGTIDTVAETVTIERDWNAPGIRSLAGVLRFRDYGSYIEDLKRGETVVFADAETDPRTAASAEALKAISAQSVVNMPVTEQGGVVALLYLNHATAREWSAEDLAFIREVAERTRTAVERRRAERELRDLAASLEAQVKARTEELMAAEEALRQSQKMEAVGQLTGGIAHDFNNLLTGIIGSLELLNTRISQGRLGEVDRYVTAAQGAAKRAAALTHRLLAFSRRQTLDPKPTDANRLVAGMEELIRRTVGPAVEVEVVAAGGLWTTMVDTNQLENALLNLCINARDAMPDGGKLTVETGNRWLDERAARLRDLPPGQYVTLCVSDNGTGMTPEVAARAFDPFFTTKPLGQGTGLGLSMIYGFVRQSGGQARIYSEPGGGTMVCLYLPRHHGDAAAAEGRPDAAEPPRAERGETVLVVDDEPTVRMLVAEVLEELGYAAIEAADGAAGVQALRSDARIDLLVTDVGLPGGMNGRQVADAAREARPGLPVLFITGYAENAVLSHGHLEPGMHVLTKPFAMETLAARIKAIVSER